MHNLNEYKILSKNAPRCVRVSVSVELSYFLSKLSIQADSKDDIVTKKSSHTSNYMHFYSKWLINIQRLGAMVFFFLHWSLSEMFNFIFMWVACNIRQKILKMSSILIMIKPPNFQLHNLQTHCKYLKKKPIILSFEEWNIFNVSLFNKQKNFKSKSQFWP